MVRDPDSAFNRKSCITLSITGRSFKAQNWGRARNLARRAGVNVFHNNGSAFSIATINLFLFSISFFCANLFPCIAHRVMVSPLLQALRNWLARSRIWSKAACDSILSLADWDALGLHGDFKSGRPELVVISIPSSLIEWGLTLSYEMALSNDDILIESDWTRDWTWSKLLFRALTSSSLSIGLSHHTAATLSGPSSAHGK